MRQAGPSGCSRANNSPANANVSTRSPMDPINLANERRIAGSSSRTNTTSPSFMGGKLYGKQRNHKASTGSRYVTLWYAHGFTAGLNQLRRYLPADQRKKWHPGDQGSVFPATLPDAPQPNDRLKHPARLTEHSDGRAVATYVDSLGLQHKLHLVNIGERWWISGYTMQYESLVEEQMLDRLDEITRRRAEVKRQLLPRLLAGEFRTPEDYYSLEHRLLEQ